MHVYNIGCDSITETNEDQFFIRECGMHVQECPVVRPEGSCHVMSHSSDVLTRKVLTRQARYPATSEGNPQARRVRSDRLSHCQRCLSDKMTLVGLTVVGRLIKKQERRFDKQRSCQCKTHTPTSTERSGGPLLIFLAESETYSKSHMSG